jgi:hypothetical protein
VEQAEQTMRGTIYPVYSGIVQPFLDVVRDLYNPLICWWDAGAWWGYGMVIDVIYPTVRDCGSLKAFFLALLAFIDAVAKDVVYYFASTNFMTQNADLTRTTIAGIALSKVWVSLYMCACSDIGNIVRTLPILNPIIVLGFFTGGAGFIVWGVLGAPAIRYHTRISQLFFCSALFGRMARSSNVVCHIGFGELFFKLAAPSLFAGRSSAQLSLWAGPSWNPIYSAECHGGSQLFVRRH